MRPLQYDGSKNAAEIKRCSKAHVRESVLLQLGFGPYYRRADSLLTFLARETVPAKRKRSQIHDCVDAMTDADDLSTTFVPAAGGHFASARNNRRRMSSPLLPALQTTEDVEHDVHDTNDALSSPDDGVRKSLVIDMKNMIGDAVGNVLKLLVRYLPVH
jgi:hypothetical protein